MKSYSEKFKDPRWQKKRLEVLNEHNFECQSCGDTGKQLHVHHPAYKKGAEPWEYKSCELMCLCGDCHAEEHYCIEIVTTILNEIKFSTNLIGNTNNMELAGLLTAYSHEGPFDMQVFGHEFASGVGIYYRKSAEEIISYCENHVLPYEVIERLEAINCLKITKEAD